MEKKTTHIFRKEKGQIVVHGKVNLTDVNGNKITHGERFTLCGCAKSKNCLFVMVHIKSKLKINKNE